MLYFVALNRSLTPLLGILSNLKGRFLTQNLPYTFMASAMIAVNPLRYIQDPSMYTYVDKAVNQVK